MNNKELNSKRKSGFFDLPKREVCNHPEHGMPMYLHIPAGKGYRHVCPGCGIVIETTGLNYV